MIRLSQPVGQKSTSHLHVHKNKTYLKKVSPVMVALFPAVLRVEGVGLPAWLHSKTMLKIKSQV